MSGIWTQCEWQFTYPIDQLYRGEIQSWYYQRSVSMYGWSGLTPLRNNCFWAVAGSENSWILAKFFRDCDEVEVNENWHKKQNIRLSWPNYSQLPLQRTLVGMYSLAKKLSREENSFSREIPRGQDGRVANENAGFASDHARSRIPPYTVNSRPRGGEGYSKNFYMGRLRPEVQPLARLYTIPFPHTLFRTLHHF